MNAMAIRLFLALGMTAALVSPGCAGTLSNSAFSDYTPLSSNLELVRRLTTPLKAAQLPAILASQHATLGAQAIDLSKESFALFVPSTEPATGYGLLVFIPPWNDARLPDGWDSVLDAAGMIFVSAAQSGNDQSVLARREPLAILAEQNVAHRYTIDPERIYIAGFSGGSRVAMRLALAYPGVFRGAILDAGSDPIGSADIPLPPVELFRRFQDKSHLVYVTGDEDLTRLGMAAVSMRSMHDWCMFGVEAQEAARAGHQAASATTLAHALAALRDATPPDGAEQAACRARIDKEIELQFATVETLIAAGDRKSARDVLDALDKRFGGLASPRSLTLSQAIAQMK
ncbi:MAG TPA: PHB depolymerase family esterase [Rhizomicrobium sp.]